MENEVYLTRVMTFVEKRAEIEVVTVEGNLAIVRTGIPRF